MDIYLYFLFPLYSYNEMTAQPLEIVEHIAIAAKAVQHKIRVEEQARAALLAVGTGFLWQLVSYAFIYK